MSFDGQGVETNWIRIILNSPSSNLESKLPELSNFTSKKLKPKLPNKNLYKNYLTFQAKIWSQKLLKFSHSQKKTSFNDGCMDISGNFGDYLD